MARIDPIYSSDFTLGSGWNVRLTLFTQWRSSAAKNINNCSLGSNGRKLTRRVELLSAEKMAKVASTVSASDFGPTSKSVVTHAVHKINQPFHTP